MTLLLREPIEDGGLVHVAVGGIIENGDGDEVTMTFCFQTAFLRSVRSRARANGFLAKVMSDGPPTCIRCLVKALSECLSDKHQYGAR